MPSLLEGFERPTDSPVSFPKLSNVIADIVAFLNLGFYSYFFAWPFCAGVTSARLMIISEAMRIRLIERDCVFILILLVRRGKPAGYSE